MKFLAARVSCCLLTGGSVLVGQESSSFVNFETAPVHPVALSPDGRTLAVCNLPDQRVELFDVSSGVPMPAGDVPVGVDPVSVRFRTTNELWVVNHISASVSIVDLAGRRIVSTLPTKSGPADVVFAGQPPRAFVSCAREDIVQVFDPVTRSAVTNLAIEGDRPKALAVSPDGTKVYVAIFESGNASTLLTGVDVLTDARGPHGGQLPTPNVGTNLVPALYRNPNRDPALYQSLLPDSIIVKKDGAGHWMDDNHGDWTEFVSGTNATASSRPAGWDLPDRDLGIIDATTLVTTYATNLLNICMDVSVNPVSGRIAVAGTDATNERRFTPNLRGTFLRVNLAFVDPGTLAKTVIDLNPHLDYSTSSVPSTVRNRSIGDPRGIVWSTNGARGYVTGMGSRNLIVIDADGNRVAAAPIELGEGPTGLAVDEARQRLYILNRFSATIAVLDTVTLTVLTNVAFHDSTPPAIKRGRRHLYDTRDSGLGHVACASCHVDARMDRLAWDLGDPTGDMPLTPVVEAAFHPLKGPLVTQTLQDIIGQEPLHWRGDRVGIEEFNGTFTNLLGADTELTSDEMRELKDFLGTIHFPPNRFRNFDNSLPTKLPLPYGSPLPTGNAQAGRQVFQVSSCIGCHQNDAGRGSARDDPLALREGGRPFKVAQLRSLPDKIGMNTHSASSRVGFGFRFDGRSDTLMEFLFSLEFASNDSKDNADLIAFLLAFTGSGVGFNPSSLAPSKDAATAVGRQVTLAGPETNALVEAMLALVEAPTNRVDLVARGVRDGRNRGWFYDRHSGRFQSDRNNEALAAGELLALAAAGRELTLTVVPSGSGRRLGIDRDEDGYFDRTEIESGLDPADPLSRGSNTPPRLDPLPSFVIHNGIPVKFLPSAIDPDGPDQVLRFTFASDAAAPAGATLDPETGAFAWTPSPDQGDQLYRIALRVTDTGSPPLSDSQAAEVSVVSFRILAVDREADSDALWVTFRSIPGHRYQLQFKERLADPLWADVPGGLIPVVPTEIFALRDAAATITSQRFYRVYSAQ